MMTAKEIRDAQAKKKAEMLERTLRMIEGNLQKAASDNEFPNYIDVDINRDLATTIRTMFQEKGFLVGQRSDSSEGELRVTLRLCWEEDINNL
jgi:hypothetical protein